MLKNSELNKIVVKIGTKVLTGKGFSLDRNIMKSLTEQICALKEEGVRVVVVSSGAIISGMGLLGLKNRPLDLPRLQACAAIGQPHLMQAYDSLFKARDILTAQILLTQDDLNDRKRYLNAKHTLLTLLNEGVVPIVNENDTVLTDEIRFGDNDKLSSLVANLIEADLLILLSDVDGLCDKFKEGSMVPIPVVEKISERTESLAAKGTDLFGTGGMSSKICAAKITVNSGIPCIIANGRKENILLDIFNNKRTGTLFVPVSEKLASRKRWLGFGAKPKGTIKVDNGAREALTKRSKSLLASGIISTDSDFKRDEIVRVVDADGCEFARGISNYSSQDLDKIKGLKTAQISKVLGSKSKDEVIHRDNLVILT